jgi:AAA+ superfamily predicted ATPase
MKTRIINYLRAGYPALYLVSHEEQRIERLLAEVAKETPRSLYAWSISTGRQNVTDGSVESLHDPVEVLDGILSMPDDSLLLLRDFHFFMTPDYPMHAVLIRKFKESLYNAKARGITLLVLSSTLKIPAELEKLITPIEFSLPDHEALHAVLTSICTTNGVEIGDENTLSAILDAASGLTTGEAEDAFALSIVESGSVDPKIIAREKSNTIAKNGLLELVPPAVSLDSIGGLEALKQDFSMKRKLFSREAAAYGLEAPRGAIVVGQPGTGKSLTAKALGSIFNIPLLRLEASKLFGSLVGQSEANWRTAFATARAVAPCILWVDEADGLFSGAGGGSHDGGTTNRVIKTILQDMQDNSKGIFFIFTANDIDNIPDPVIDRLECWSVDLPHESERRAIWSIHIAKVRGERGREPEEFDLDAIAAASDGFSGRQIEQTWIKAATFAFNHDREPTTADVVETCKATIPTSKTMAAQIEARRTRLQGRAQPASIPLGTAFAKEKTRKIIK